MSALAFAFIPEHLRFLYVSSWLTLADLTLSHCIYNIPLRVGPQAEEDLRAVYGV